MRQPRKGREKEGASAEGPGKLPVEKLCGCLWLQADHLEARSY